MTKRVLYFLRDERGETAIEYGLIASGIFLAIVAAVSALGTQVDAKFTAVSNAFK
jgi:pilus assembly protein Flp/PilA